MSSSIRPVLRIRRYSTLLVLQRAYAIINGMGADPARFAAPNPPISVLQGQIAKVELAHKVSLNRTTGTAAVCKAERNILYDMLESERAYVRTLCAASPSDAEAIIQAAGMLIAASGSRELPILKVSRGAAPGSADLRAAVSILLGGRTAKAKCFDWESTTDGGKTFNAAPSTAIGKTTITSLAPLTLVGFRVRVTTTEGPSEWSPIVSIVIH